MQKKKNKPSVLFVFQLPPPIHGASIMNEIVKNSEAINGVFQGTYIGLNFASGTDDIGSISIKKLLFALRYAWSIFFVLLTKKIDLVYFTLSPIGGSFLRDLVYVFLFKIFNKKVVYHLHGKGISKARKSRKILNRLYKWAFKNVYIIHLDDSLLYDIEGLPYKKHFIVANGISELLGAEIPSANDGVKGTLKVVYLSNYKKNKGILDYVKAVQTLNAEGFSFEAMAVGGDADVSKVSLKSFVKKNGVDNLHVSGPIYGVEKYKLLQECNIFVLPTYYENECFPLSILEAFQFGLAIVSYDNGAVKSMVEHNKGGLITKMQDIQGLTDSLRQLIQHPEKLEKMGAYNRKKFKDKFTKEKFEANLNKALQGVLQDG